MIISNMTEKDWLNMMKEVPTFLTDGQPYDEECVDVIQNELPLLHHEVKNSKPPAKKKKVKKSKPFEDAANTVSVLYMEMETARAKFFVTDDTAFHKHGFWIPKSMLKSFENGQVVMKSGFEPNIVEWK